MGNLSHACRELLDYIAGTVYIYIYSCDIIPYFSNFTSPSVLLKHLVCVLATLSIPVSITKIFFFTISQSVDTERTGLAGDLKIRGLKEALEALLYPSCNAANVLAANYSQHKNILLRKLVWLCGVRS